MTTRSHGPPCPKSKPIQPEGLEPWGRLSQPGLKQALPDEPPLRNPAGTGENPAAGVGHELVQHVKLCQLVEDLDEASAKVALVAYEQEPGVVLKTLAPGRPALNGEINPIVVGVGTPQNLCALIARRGGETDMRALGN